MFKSSAQARKLYSRLLYRIIAVLQTSNAYELDCQPKRILLKIRESVLEFTEQTKVSGCLAQCLIA